MNKKELAERSFPASRDGSCPVCGGAIKAGDLIRKRYSAPRFGARHSSNVFNFIGYGHSVCPTTPAQRRRSAVDAQRERIRVELRQYAPVYQQQIEWIDSGRVTPEWVLAIKANPMLETAWGEWQDCVNRAAMRLVKTTPITGECQQTLLGIHRTAGRVFGLTPGSLEGWLNPNEEMILRAIGRYREHLVKVVEAIANY